MSLINLSGPNHPHRHQRSGGNGDLSLIDTCCLAAASGESPQPQKKPFKRIQQQQHPLNLPLAAAAAVAAATTAAATTAAAAAAAAAVVAAAAATAAPAISNRIRCGCFYFTLGYPGGLTHTQKQLF